MRRYINYFKDFKINEIFDPKSIYDVSIDDYKEYGDSKSYRYSFITKDHVRYRVLLSIYKKDGVAKIDFDTISDKNKDHNSIISLINTGDVYKVINTLKFIIGKHDDIKKLIIYSSRERMDFYKKILDYMNIRNEYVDGYLIGHLKKQ